MRHIGYLASAFVDGQLNPADSERVAMHLSRCDRCRAEVAAERQVKAQLSGLDEPGPSDGLIAALAAVPGRPLLSRVGDAGPHRPGSRRRYVLTGVASLTVAVVGGALAAGSAPSGPPVSPPISRFLLEHAATTGELPLSDPGVAAVTASYAQQAQP